MLGHFGKGFSDLRARMVITYSPFRLVVALLMLLPVTMFGGLQLVAKPDLETWLAHQTQGYARQDAFDHVTAISYYFTPIFAFTSLIAAYLVVSIRSQFLIPLVIGPLLSSLVYLADYGTSDPNWYSLLALLGIGMLVSSLVTTVWVASTSARSLEQVMKPQHIDAASLIDAKALLARGEFPYTFLAFPPNSVGQDGLPTDAEAQEYIAVIQSLGVKVGIWADTPTTDSYAFVGPSDIDRLHTGLDTLEKSGRFPKGYAERLSNRLLGVAADDS